MIRSPSIILTLFLAEAISSILTRVLFGTVKTLPDSMRRSTPPSPFEESAVIKSVKALSSTDTIIELRPSMNNRASEPIERSDACVSVELFFDESGSPLETQPERLKEARRIKAMAVILLPIINSCSS